MKLFFPFQRQTIFEMISDFSYYGNKWKEETREIIHNTPQSY